MVCDVGVNEVQPMPSYDDAANGCGKPLGGGQGGGFLPPCQLGVRSEAYDTMAGFLRLHLPKMIAQAMSCGSDVQIH